MIKGWKIKKLGQLCSFINDGTHQTPKYVKEGIPFYSVENVTNNNFKNCKYISEKEHLKLKQRCNPEKNDILMTRIGSIGECKLIDWDINASIYVSLALLKTNDIIRSDYLAHYINSKNFQKEAIKLALPNATPKKINTQSIREIPIFYPSSKLEQREISSILTNIDLYIEDLKKLIGKKKLIKQGVMQELLTGKKRLPGFNKPWHTECLKKLAKDIKTGTKNNEDKNIYGKYPFFVRSQNIEKIDSYSYEGEAILIPGEGNIGKIFHYINGKFDYHQRVYKLSDFQNISGKFLYFYLLNYFGRYALKNTVKATVDSLRLDTFHKFNVFLPTELKEQEVIANILTNMDEEIESLEQDLEKYKHIKQGMMEQLLTGKIRLIEFNENIQSMSDKKHNQHFDDAVVFANIVASCYSPDYPLGRKKCQKMMYLFKRFNNSSVEQFGHYAAGPYDNKARYGGFETIAIKNKYVVENKSNKGSSFAPGPEIDKAKSYCSKYGYDKFIPIFNQYLKFKKVDELELYTTVDKTILELKEQNLPINLNTVKNYISNDKTWVPKLSREVFNDENIEEAIRFSQLILGV